MCTGKLHQSLIEKKTEVEIVKLLTPVSEDILSDLVVVDSSKAGWIVVDKTKSKLNEKPDFVVCRKAIYKNTNAGTS